MRLAAIAIALAATCAHAEFLTGNELMTRLQDAPGSTSRSIALGYVAGVADAGLGGNHCTPAGVTLAQIIDITLIAMNAQPNDRHYPADAIIWRALKYAYPCPKKGTSL